MKLLIVDDDPSVTASIALLLKQHGFTSLSASNPVEALSLLKQHNFDLVLQDMNFSRNTSGEEGMELLSEIKALYPLLPVILMTAWGSIELAVNGIKQGAADFVTKPWKNQQLLQTIETCIELNRPASQSPLTRHELDQQFQLDAIVGEDPKLLDILTTLGRVAATNASVLILGESGTGKELIADAIHNNSQRADQTMVKVNLGGMNESLFESEMFGHVKGAFTDAKRDRQGRFALAKGGTLFLDEVGDLNSASQVKLLRVLQDQSYQPVGSSQTFKADVRVVSATNCDLNELIAEGRFREDLFYRLNLITLELPPLRNRPNDIRLLAERHLRRVESLYGLQKLAIEDNGYEWLLHQPWPGNIRQLTQTIERTILMSGVKSISATDLMAYSPQSQSSTELSNSMLPDLTLDQMEKLMIEKSMMAYQGNISKVADALGISRGALYRRLEKFGIQT